MDEAGLGPSGELSIHGFHGDVAEVGGDVAGAPEAGGVFFEQSQDPVAAAIGGGGVPVVAGDGGELGCASQGSRTLMSRPVMDLSASAANFGGVIVNSCGAVVRFSLPQASDRWLRGGGGDVGSRRSGGECPGGRWR